MTDEQLDKLAHTVAKGIKRGFDSYQGPKNRIVNGNYQPLRFKVRVPELEGKSIHELVTGGLHTRGSFYNRVWFDGPLGSKTLFGIEFTFEIVRDRYTGTVTVHEAISNKQKIR